jgi:uncharacterized delta-60 repeat protein
MKKLYLLAAWFLSISCIANAQQLGLDSTFGYGGYHFGAFPNGGTGGSVNDMIITPAGNFILGGSHSSPGNSNIFTTLMRFNSDGTLDTVNFGNNGIVAHSFTFRNSCDGIAVQPDGKVLVAGHENSSNAGSTVIPCLSRYNSDGTVDYSFADSGRVAIRFDPISSGRFFKPIVLANGKILAVGMSSGNINGGVGGYGIMRFNSDGTLDNTFAQNGKVVVPDGVQNRMEVIVQPDGKILIGAENRPYPDPIRFGAARFHQNGDLDSTFGTNGLFLVPFHHFLQEFGSMALQPDGKILFFGTSNQGTYYDFLIMRLTSSGAIDSSFGQNGFAIISFNQYVNCYSGLVYPNGRILAAGRHPVNSDDAAFAQFTSAGLIDSSFGNGNGTFIHPINQVGDRTSARRVMLDSNGKLIVGGNVNFESGFILARFDHLFTGVSENENELAVKLYPNPSDGTFQLKVYSATDSDSELQITTADGSLVYSRRISLKPGENIELVDMEKYPAGVYLLNISGSSHNFTKILVRY